MSQGSPRQKQRRFRRRMVRVLVDFVADGNVHCHYAMTLGAGGLFVETETPLPVETPLRVRFRLPGGDRVHEIEARVAWRQEPESTASGRRAPGMGVEFLDAVAASALARDLDQLDA